MDDKSLIDWHDWNINYGDLTAGGIILILFFFAMCVGCTIVRLYSDERVNPDRIDDQDSPKDVSANITKEKAKLPSLCNQHQAIYENALYIFLFSMFDLLFNDPLNILFLYDVLISMIGISIILFQTHPKLMIKCSNHKCVFGINAQKNK